MTSKFAIACKRKREEHDDIFAGIPIVSWKPAVKTTWNDTEPGKRTCYTLYKLKNDAKIVELGRKVFEQLHTSMKIRTPVCCSLLLLAYNLKDAQGNSLFGDVSPDLLSEDNIIFPKTHVKTISKVSRFRETPGADDVAGRDRLLAVGYSFLAASYLRLVSKSAEDYGKIEHHLKKGFKSHYGFDLPFQNYHPNLEIASLVKGEFDFPEVKNTLYNLLYAGRVVEHGKSIKDFLYGAHLELTGLHPFTLFEKCLDAYKVDRQKLVSILNMKMFEDELEHIGLIFDNFYGGDEKVKLGMWRYARIFDPVFMSMLQTKRCCLFTATLANLFHMKVPITPTRNFLRIVVLNDEMTRRDKLLAEEIAKVAFRLINEDAFE